MGMNERKRNLRSENLRRRTRGGRRVRREGRRAEGSEGKIERERW